MILLVMACNSDDDTAPVDQGFNPELLVGSWDLVSHKLTDGFASFATINDTITLDLEETGSNYSYTTVFLESGTIESQGSYTIQSSFFDQETGELVLSTANNFESNIFVQEGWLLYTWSLEDENLTTLVDEGQGITFDLFSRIKELTTTTLKVELDRGQENLSNPDVPDGGILELVYQRN